MAKHPHRLILLNKKTWRCTFEGCSFFVHLGLAHVLVGKEGVCWNCENRFTITEESLRDEKPVCDDCRIGIPADTLSEFIDARLLGIKKDEKK